MIQGPPQDADLVRRACLGDDDALEELVGLYHDRVYRYGAAYCAADDLADAVQNTFLAFIRTRTSFRGDASIGTWLYTAVRNACLQLLRPRARERRLLGERITEDHIATVAAQDPGPDEQAARREVVGQVRDALAALAPHHLEILVLRDVEGLSGHETAQHLGIHLAAMKSRLKRARTALAAELAARS